MKARLAVVHAWLVRLWRTASEPVEVEPTEDREWWRTW